MCAEMVAEDLKAAQQTALLRLHSFHTVRRWQGSNREDFA
jgi:hypothetical protein